MAEREHDVVLFGATGFTGALTAEYLSQHADPGTRWALAGRNREKLEAVRGRLGAGHGELPLIEADTTDAASMRRLAESTRVVITTVGPYINYGEPLVAACAAAGTDYVDLTGEPEFVDLMWLRHHAEAERTGARLVHSCGFDSIPYDLGAQFTVEQLPEGQPIELQGFVRVGGTFSGGTYHSAVHIMSRLRQGMQVARERRQQESRPTDRRVRGVPGRPHNDPVGGGWVVPFPTIDPQTVLRSARALDRYGPDFSYSHYLVVGALPTAVGLAAGAGAVIGLAQLPPTRNLLLKLKNPGEGPSPERRAKSWFKVRFLGQSGGRRTVTEVSGGDPGYTETSKMLAQSALCLAH
ncbi:MAG TPA: saccharopine dehydrogenase NADP-binding domain-containing protein, partial [Solirubrobacteraceae bacterium]|nr:saccharopine dehydrogenase NADP-binding domain-containing protein [Solirubrobacteraceae bacterium]